MTQTDTRVESIISQGADEASVFVEAAHTAAWPVRGAHPPLFLAFVEPSQSTVQELSRMPRRQRWPQVQAPPHRRSPFPARAEHERDAWKDRSASACRRLNIGRPNLPPIPFQLSVAEPQHVARRQRVGPSTGRSACIEKESPIQRRQLRERSRSFEVWYVPQSGLLHRERLRQLDVHNLCRPF